MPNFTNLLVALYPL